jgi:hypothetical protein
MRAKEITNIDPAASAASNLPLIFATRIAEMWSLAASIDDPSDVDGLHDLRIAAKRVRYLLEFFEDSFDDDFEPLRDEFKQLQDLLGETHDCDEWATHLCKKIKSDQFNLSAVVTGEHGTAGASVQLLELARQVSAGLDPGPEQAVAIFLIEICERRHRMFSELQLYWSALEEQDFQARLSDAVYKAAEQD